jgi:hypothetical protein
MAVTRAVELSELAKSDLRPTHLKRREYVEQVFLALHKQFAFSRISDFKELQAAPAEEQFRGVTWLCQRERRLLVSF